MTIVEKRRADELLDKIKWSIESKDFNNASTLHNQLYDGVIDTCHNRGEYTITIPYLETLADLSSHVAIRALTLFYGESESDVTLDYVVEKFKLYSQNGNKPGNYLAMLKLGEIYIGGRGKGTDLVKKFKDELHKYENIEEGAELINRAMDAIDESIGLIAKDIDAAREGACTKRELGIFCSLGIAYTKAAGLYRQLLNKLNIVDTIETIEKQSNYIDKETICYEKFLEWESKYGYLINSEIREDLRHMAEENIEPSKEQLRKIELSLRKMTDPSNKMAMQVDETSVECPYCGKIHYRKVHCRASYCNECKRVFNTY